MSSARSWLKRICAARKREAGKREHHVGLDVRRVGDVPGPAADRGSLVLPDARPVRLRDAERGADGPEPRLEDGRGAPAHEVCEGLAQVRPLRGYLAQAGLPQVAGDALEMAGERGIERGGAHGFAVSSFG